MNKQHLQFKFISPLTHGWLIGSLAAVNYWLAAHNIKEFIIREHEHFYAVIYTKG
jgi:hypothetical protein